MFELLSDSILETFGRDFVGVGVWIFFEEREMLFLQNFVHEKIIVVSSLRL